ncbi:MAG: phosphoadenosine phosphosulfate reductase family protein [Vicinamibacterales bacterium]
MRVFPLSNWTELDIWQYIAHRAHPNRSALSRRSSGQSSMRRRSCFSWWTTTAYRLAEGETPVMKKVRFRTLGCYPLTAAIESDADYARRDNCGDPSSRAPPSGRDASSISDEPGSMEKKKQEGYF